MINREEKWKKTEGIIKTTYDTWSGKMEEKWGNSLRHTLRLRMINISNV